mmetsp:Transcript_19086/g.41282  ORF Transcript_19086/g.41282 Transcript_19086/m.41282 type:complete len:536 (+) Transcript_19086:71-1678(+)
MSQQQQQNPIDESAAAAAAAAAFMGSPGTMQVGVGGVPVPASGHVQQSQQSQQSQQQSQQSPYTTAHHQSVGGVTPVYEVVGRAPDGGPLIARRDAVQQAQPGHINHAHHGHNPHLQHHHHQPYATIDAYGIDPVTHHQQHHHDQLHHAHHHSAHHAHAADADSQKKRKRFSQNEKEAVRKGVEQFGPGQWKQIKEAHLPLLHARTTVQIKDCYRTMLKRGDIPPDLGEEALRKLAQAKAEKTGGPYDPATAGKRQKKRKFTNDEKNAILAGISTKGFGHWEQIRQEHFDILGHRTSLQIKDCFRTMVKLGQAQRIEEDDETKRERKRRFAAKARDAKKKKKAVADAEYAEEVVQQQHLHAASVHPDQQYLGGVDPQQQEQQQAHLMAAEARGVAAAAADVVAVYADEAAFAAASVDASGIPHDGGGDAAEAEGAVAEAPDAANAEEELTYANEEEYYHWPNLWARLQSQGWSQVRPGRQHKLLDWLYVVPGGNARGGQLGHDFFGSEQDVTDYVRSTQPFDGANNQFEDATEEV